MPLTSSSTGLLTAIVPSQQVNKLSSLYNDSEHSPPPRIASIFKTMLCKRCTAFRNQ